MAITDCTSSFPDEYGLRVDRDRRRLLCEPVEHATRRAEKVRHHRAQARRRLDQTVETSDEDVAVFRKPPPMVGTVDAAKDRAVDVCAMATDVREPQMRTVTMPPHDQTLDAQRLPNVVDVIGVFVRIVRREIDLPRAYFLGGGATVVDHRLLCFGGCGRHRERHAECATHNETWQRQPRAALVEQDDVGHAAQCEHRWEELAARAWKCPLHPDRRRDR